MFHWMDLFQGVSMTLNPFYTCFDTVEELSHRTMDATVDVLTVIDATTDEPSNDNTKTTTAEKTNDVADNETEDENVHLLYECESCKKRREKKRRLRRQMKIQKLRFVKV